HRFVEAADPALEVFAQGDPQVVNGGSGGDAQRVVAAGQVRLGDRHAQVAGFVQFGKREVVQVAGQDPLAAFGTGDEVDPAQLAQHLLHQGVGQARLQALDVVAVQAAPLAPRLGKAP